MREHSGLYRGDGKIIHHGVDLRGDEAGVHIHDRSHTDCILRGECGNSACAKNAKYGEGLEVGLDTGAAAGIRARDCERNFDHTSPRADRPPDSDFTRAMDHQRYLATHATPSSFAYY